MVRKIKEMFFFMLLLCISSVNNTCYGMKEEELNKNGEKDPEGQPVGPQVVPQVQLPVEGVDVKKNGKQLLHGLINNEEQKCKLYNNLQEYEGTMGDFFEANKGKFGKKEVEEFSGLIKSPELGKKIEKSKFSDENKGLLLKQVEEYEGLLTALDNYRMLCLGHEIFNKLPVAAQRCLEYVQEVEKRAGDYSLIFSEGNNTFDSYISQKIILPKSLEQEKNLRKREKKNIKVGSSDEKGEYIEQVLVDHQKKMLRLNDDFNKKIYDEKDQQGLLKKYCEGKEEFSKDIRENLSYYSNEQLDNIFSSVEGGGSLGIIEGAKEHFSRRIKYNLDSLKKEFNLLFKTSNTNLDNQCLFQRIFCKSTLVPMTAFYEDLRYGSNEIADEGVLERALLIRFERGEDLVEYSEDQIYNFIEELVNENVGEVSAGKVKGGIAVVKIISKVCENKVEAGQCLYFDNYKKLGFYTKRLLKILHSLFSTDMTKEFFKEELVSKEKIGAVINGKFLNYYGHYASVLQRKIMRLREIGRCSVSDDIEKQKLTGIINALYTKFRNPLYSVYLFFKPIASGMWSYVNSSMKCEDTNIYNELYFFAPFLCFGYRYKHYSMPFWLDHIDVNFNFVGGALDVTSYLLFENLSLKKFYQNLVNYERMGPSWWSFSTYVFFSFLNINLNIKYGRFLFAINLVGIIRAFAIPILNFINEQRYTEATSDAEAHCGLFKAFLDEYNHRIDKMEKVIETGIF